MSSIYRAILENKFPAKVRYALRGIFDEAYAITNEAINTVKWLESNPVATGVRADLLRAACSHVATLWCSKGILPFECTFLPNTVKNCYHVEMVGEGVRLFLARVDTPEAIAHQSIFRNNAFHQLSLFPELSRDQTGVVKGFLATYGDGGKKEFQFGRIGIPGNHSWLDSIPLNGGPFQFASKSEHDELLVSLLEGVSKEGDNIEGQGKS